MGLEKNLHSKQESAVYLGISPRKLDYLISSKEIGPIVRIGKRVLIPRKTLESFCRRKAQ